jgi:hypothetical protein
MLARELEHLGAVNIGAAGTFVFQQPIGRRRLRQEIARRLPFDAEIVMCDGRETVALLSTTVFDRYARQPDVVRFVSVLSRRSVLAPRLPVTLPARGRWLLKVLARDGRFVLGMYRRQMKVIGYLGSLDRLFGVPATTRNWNTMTAVARVVSGSES